APLPPAVEPKPPATCHPEYPVAALRAQVQGATRLRVYVDEQGWVTRAFITQRSGGAYENGLLDEAAAASFTDCRFTPALDASGKPVCPWGDLVHIWKLN